MWNKGISIPLAIGIILIVAIFGGGMIYWQSLNIPERYFGKGSIEEPIEEDESPVVEKTKNETADWYIYKNEGYGGFEIKYPGGTKIFDVDAKDGWFFLALPFSLSPTDNMSLQLDIRINIANSCPSNVDISYVNINGINFSKTDKSNDFSGIEGRAVATDYCVVENNKVYELITRIGYNKNNQPSESDIQKGSEMFSQMLSTFKFIEIDETANWKTYTNQEYEFEMKYKPNLLSGEISEYLPGWWIGLPDIKSFEFTYCDNCPSPDTVIDHINICQYSVIATIFDNVLNLSFDDWFTKYGKDFGYSNQTKEEILINGIKGIKTGSLGNMPPNGGNLNALASFPKGSLIYSIFLNVNEEVISSTTTYSQCLTSGSKVFEQMLSTFRFLD